MSARARSALVVLALAATAGPAPAEDTKVSVVDTPAVLWDPGHTITVNIQPPATGDKARDEEYFKAVESALKGWNDYQVKQFGAKGYRVKAVRNGKPTDKYDVTVHWGDRLPDGDLATTAITAQHVRTDENAPPIYRGTKADIFITRLTKSDKPRSADAVKFLAQHEFGHAEGCHHCLAGKVMSEGETFPDTDDAPPSVDLTKDPSAKMAKTAIHTRVLDPEAVKGEKNKGAKKNKFSYVYDPDGDECDDPIRQAALRVGDPGALVTDLPAGWLSAYEPDVGLGDVTLNGADTFFPSGFGAGWLTLWASDPQYYVPAGTGFGFSVETDQERGEFFGGYLYNLRSDDCLTYYTASFGPAAVPAPPAAALGAVGAAVLLAWRRAARRQAV